MGKIRYTDGWEGRDAQFNLKVGEEYFHYQAKRVLPEELRNKFLSALNNEVTLTTTKRKVKSINYNGINADSLNKSVRYSLNQKFNNNYNYGIYVEELYFEDGIVRWGKKKKGFDFGFLDVENTLIKFRNKCFGRIHYNDGEKQWRKYLKNIDNFHDLAEDIKSREQIGNDIHCDDSRSQLIAGEIQFGNWALGSKDILGIVNTFASNQNSVDLVIYITNTGKLEDYLSDNIVTYSTFLENIRHYGNIMNIPIWLIGLDIEL